MKRVAVIGGGIAGMEASAFLSAMGYSVCLIEKSNQLGGHLLQWERLFPTKRLGKEVLAYLRKGITTRIDQRLLSSVKSSVKENNLYKLELQDGEIIECDAVLITTGFEVFDARKKEEYGYGIYDNVITSADLEVVFSEGQSLKSVTGDTPRKVGFLHCVGSRDEKVGNTYCSKVCCVTAVKQAIEIKEKYPQTECYCFYMDLRMFGMRFEDLYREAQEKHGIQFIRGRISEAAEAMDGKVIIKAEDTLIGKPIKMTLDHLVLMVGFVPSAGTREMAKLFGIPLNDFGFIQPLDDHTLTNVSTVPGVYFAGTSTGPKEITNVIADARSAALKVASFLENYEIEKRVEN